MVASYVFWSEMGVALAMPWWPKGWREPGPVVGNHGVRTLKKSPLEAGFFASRVLILLEACPSVACVFDALAGCFLLAVPLWRVCFETQ